MRILLAGASGAIGRPLVQQLGRSGHDVIAIVRSEPAEERARADGAETVVADVLDRDALLRAVERRHADAVVSELTALAKPPLRHADMRATNVLRTRGTANLLDVAREIGARRFVTQSMVFGYGYDDLGETPLTEHAPFGIPTGTPFDQHLEAMAANERLAFEADGIDGVSLRYGLFYGGDAENVAAMLRKRMLPAVRSGGRLPFVHHDDAAAATVVAIERGEGGRAYNVADDEPVAFGTLVEAIADATRAPRPWHAPAPLVRALLPYGGAMMARASMRVSTDALRDLGWRPRYPTYREGIAASVRA